LRLEARGREARTGGGTWDRGAEAQAHAVHGHGARGDVRGAFRRGSFHLRFMA